MKEKTEQPAGKKKHATRTGSEKGRLRRERIRELQKQVKAKNLFRMRCDLRVLENNGDLSMMGTKTIRETRKAQRSIITGCLRSKSNVLTIGNAQSPRKKKWRLLDLPPNSQRTKTLTTLVKTCRKALTSLNLGSATLHTAASSEI